MSKLIESVIATFTEDEENTVAEAIRAGKVIVLHGPPACGKTRLCNIILRVVSDEDILRISGKMLNEHIDTKVLVIEDIETSGRARAAIKTQETVIKTLCSQGTTIVHQKYQPPITVNTPELIIIETCELPKYINDEHQRRFHIIEIPMPTVSFKTPLGKNFVVRS